VYSTLAEMDEIRLKELIPSLKREALRLCHFHEMNAEDLLQDTLVKMYRYDEKYHAGLGAYSTWAFRIMKNTYVDTQRREARSASYFASSLEVEVDGSEKHWDIADAGKDEGVLDGMAIDHLLYAITQVKHGSLLMLRVEGWMYEEIAEMYNAPIGTIKAQLNKARNELAVMLQMGLNDEGKREMFKPSNKFVGGKRDARKLEADEVARLIADGHSNYAIAKALQTTYERISKARKEAAEVV
jgi:RNA polymerase sigma-70 factor, ECF subfamily